MTGKFDRTHLKGRVLHPFREGVLSKLMKAFCDSFASVYEISRLKPDIHAHKETVHHEVSVI